MEVTLLYLQQIMFGELKSLGLFEPFLIMLIITCILKYLTVNFFYKYFKKCQICYTLFVSHKKFQAKQMLMKFFYFIRKKNLKCVSKYQYPTFLYINLLKKLKTGVIMFKLNVYFLIPLTDSA